MNGDLTTAKKLYKSGGYTCVLARGEETHFATKNGIAPLLEFVDSGIDFCGFSAADKIVGKAAALLYANMGVCAVFAEVLSVSAKRVFEERNIYFEYGTLTEKIINRRGDGACPMELAAENVEDPALAPQILKCALEKLRK